MTSFSQCPGESYDEFQRLSELDDYIDLDKFTKIPFMNYIVIYCHKHDLTTIKKKFPTMKEALEFSLKVSDEDFIVNSVITDNYKISL